MKKLVFITFDTSHGTPHALEKCFESMLETIDKNDSSRAIVILVGKKDEKSHLRSLYPSIKFVFLDADVDNREIASNKHHPPKWAYKDLEMHWISSVVCRFLQGLEDELEYVEFPDWRALGFVTIQENKITGFLKEAKIAIRLCAAHTIRLKFEALPISEQDCVLMDLERKCLRDCDLIVTQSTATGNIARSIFGFTSNEWLPRLAIQNNASISCDHIFNNKTAVDNSNAPILLITDLKQSTRADLFVRSANQLVEENCEFQNTFLLASYEIDEAYKKKNIDRIISKKLKQKIKFEKLKKTERHHGQLDNSIIVDTSEFQLYNNLPYEASLRGATVILNDKNPVYGNDTAWKHEINCLKYDGTVDGLAVTLYRATQLKSPLMAISLSRTSPPWATCTRQCATRCEAKTFPLVSIIIPYYNLGNYLIKTIDSIYAQTYSNTEIIVIDDGSTDEQSIEVLKRLKSSASNNLSVVHLLSNRGLSGARNLGLKYARGKYVLTLDADDLIESKTIKTCVNALERNPDFHCVVPQAGYFIDEVDIPHLDNQRDFAEYLIFVGEAFATGGFRNMFSTSCAFFRREVFTSLKYNEKLYLYEDWELYLNMLNSGMRFLVTTEVLFYYRIREGSMVSEILDTQRENIARHDMLRSLQIAHQMNDMWFLLLLANNINTAERHIIISNNSLIRKSIELQIIITKWKLLIFHLIASRRGQYQKKIKQLIQISDRLKNI
jgi:glycosyltransferase involved in cell wall biosynthesis